MSKKPFWDIDEYADYVKIKSTNSNKYYNIISSYKNKKQAVILLSSIDLFIKEIARHIKNNFDSIPDRLKPGMLVFLEIHPNRHKLFELPVDSEFYGLNKPKNVAVDLRLPKIGKDGFLKAEKRYIFFKLRYPDGSFIPMEALQELVVHEIAHTAANHVRWRNDDHGKDYKMYYNYLKKITK